MLRSYPILLILAAAVAGCADPDAKPGLSSGPPILVSAAASLHDVFTELARVFEDRHPETEVVLNFAGSSALREQILEGAPVDVFAAADRANMDRVIQGGGVVDSPTVFARNHLQIAVPEGNPAGVTGLDDFGTDELLIGLCAEPVPCGRLARQALANAGITPSRDTDEPDVRALLTKIELGELDAGIVYATDVLAAEGRVEGIDIPDAQNVLTEYPIARIGDRGPRDLAQEFVSFVRSEEAGRILRRYGFDVP